MKMQTIDRKPKVLGGLPGSIDVIGTLKSTGQNGIATFLDTPNERKNREICWRDILARPARNSFYVLIAQ